jgi:4a-hydroxytetrahydrobiopterin dehydratase
LIADHLPAICHDSEVAAGHMTETLAEKTCTPCRGGVPPLRVMKPCVSRARRRSGVLRDDARRIERTF